MVPYSVYMLCFRLQPRFVCKTYRFCRLPAPSHSRNARSQVRFISPCFGRQHFGANNPPGCLRLVTSHSRNARSRGSLHFSLLWGNRFGVNTPPGCLRLANRSLFYGTKSEQCQKEFDIIPKTIDVVPKKQTYTNEKILKYSLQIRISPHLPSGICIFT